VVGREISGGDPFDADRFRAMTPEEMEAELDAIEADEESQHEPPGDPAEVARKLERIQLLRREGMVSEARDLLYEVLQEGDADQRMVARNILQQLDTD
jgi:sec-independent protein translocase protein TatC